jgi:alkanesulfonate monooxygenase
MWPPQLARQLATIDQMLSGRLTVNIISSDMPGETLPSAPRYQRTVETMHILRTLLNGEALDFDGEFYKLKVEPPRIRTRLGQVAAVLFRRPVGGRSGGGRQGLRRLSDVARQAGGGEGDPRRHDRARHQTRP